MNNIATANNIKFSLNSLENSSGVISAPVPNIKNEFTMHEPIRFPIAKPPSALTTAITAVIISGKAVPIATIVNPITLWLNPKIFASSLASSTTRSPPNFNRTTPIIINTIESKTLILDFSLLLFSSLSVFQMSFISIIIGYKKYIKYKITKILPSDLLIKLSGLPNIPIPIKRITRVEINATGR